MMAPAKADRNDVAIAQKAINLAPGLSGVDKAVACAILDHYNKKTGQCDPSNGRISDMLAIDERTVRRATSQLCAEGGLFRKRSHGGKSARASYTPQWSVFRAIVADWDRRMKSGSGPDPDGANRAKSPGDDDGANRAEWPGSDEHSNRAKSPGSQTENSGGEQGETVRQTGRNGPVEQGEMALQTLLRNPSYEPISTTEGSECDVVQANDHQNSGQKLHGLLNGNAGVRKASKPRSTEREATPSCSRSDAAKQAAARRLNKAIGCEAKEWREAVWLLEPEDMDAATTAEIGRRGAGIAILRLRLIDARLRHNAGLPAARAQ